MKNKINLTIYIVGFILSIVTIGLFFIDKDNAWCIISGSIGASLLGAIILSISIELSNNKKKNAENKVTFRIINSNIYSEIMSLLMIVEMAVDEINAIEGVNKKYKNKSIEELFSYFSNEIESIKYKIAPIVLKDGGISQEQLEICRNQSKMEKAVKDYDKSIIDFRKNFRELRKQLDLHKSILLINDVCTENQFFSLTATLSLLSMPSSVKQGREQELIEMGKTFQEIVDCKLVDILNDIGFDKIKFNNKNYFNVELKEDKSKNRKKKKNFMQ